MKTLVTGATGFVGSAVARQLIYAGHDVRVLTRPQSDRRNLEHLPVEIMEGDLRDIESLHRAVSGCINLFHVAADYRLWIPDPETTYDINVKGTRELILAAAKANVSRIIYTSSVATIGINEDERPADEETPSSLTQMVGHYKRSKYLAEQEVQQMTVQHNLPVVIVNPSTPIGPRDIKPTPTGRIVLDTLCGRMPAYVDTGLNIVHVDDVAIGHLLAFESGKPGERYILGGDNMSLLQILEVIAGVTGQDPPHLRLPHNLVLPIAWMMEQWARISGHEPRTTVDGIRMAKKKMFYSSDKAIREFGYRSRPAHEAIKDAIDWFRQNRYYE